MNTCDSCQWWDKSDLGPLRKCLNREKLSDHSFGDDALFAQGLHDDSAIVATGPKFGCVHHKPK